jgi:hypothetical protein
MHDDAAVDYAPEMLPGFRPPAIFDADGVRQEVLLHGPGNQAGVDYVRAKLLT